MFISYKKARNQFLLIPRFALCIKKMPVSLFCLNTPTLGLFADICEPLVKPVFFYKRIMRSALCNPAVINYKNLISVLNGCKAVCNGDNRFTPGQLGDGLLNEMLIFRVNACCCFIEYDDRCVFKYCTGNRNTLLFTA